jgi:hypothetical protein
LTVRARRPPPGLDDGLLREIMSVMASRSKLCGHFVLVTGSRKSRSVNGHLSEMRSRSMAMSSESTLRGRLWERRVWAGEARVFCC